MRRLPASRLLIEELPVLVAIGAWWYAASFARFSLPVLFMGPAILVGCIAFVSAKYGLRQGLLGSFGAALFLVSDNTAFSASGTDALAERAVMVCLSFASSLIFSTMRQAVPAAATDIGKEGGALQTAISSEESAAADAAETLVIEVSESDLQVEEIASPRFGRTEDFLHIARSSLAPRLGRIERAIMALKLHGKKLGDMETQGYIRRIESQFRRLDYVMQRLLQFARIDFDDMPVKIETFDLAKVLAEAADLVQRESPEHRIIFLPKTGAFADGDRFRVRKVVDHLIRNALRYSPPDGKIIVTTKEDSGLLVTSVRDFGSGLEEGRLSKMEAAFASDIPGAREGLGVGLYTANEIVRKLGGRMSVKSRKGKGSEFSFSLPKASSESSAAGESPTYKLPEG
ncbi:MAG TPA: HAMP domain-containing sensor histidine kinase [Candidatus Paceibacterota bacterium]|nr:HAMP domain-containing sensor histidine kinase [Candidatus Paceibacterota bacterium]